MRFRAVQHQQPCGVARVCWPYRDPLGRQLEIEKVYLHLLRQRDLGLTEQEAYLTIQRQSRQRRRPKRDVAEAILLADDLRRGCKDA